MQESTKNIVLGHSGKSKRDIRQLCRKHICFSESVIIHDIVNRLALNIWEFGLTVQKRKLPIEQAL